MWKSLPAGMAMLCCMTTSLMAETAPTTLELNAVSQAGNACRMVFTGQATAAVDQLVVETVLFDTTGAVKLLTLFDFRDLPAGKLRVRQFDIPETNCSSIGRVLFNDIDSCAGAGCDSGLTGLSRVNEIEVLG